MPGYGETRAPGASGLLSPGEGRGEEEISPSAAASVSSSGVPSTAMVVRMKFERIYEYSPS